ncbi:hypothetical protein ACP_2911 [Acidobacterium capsulatum ATCC 51196]|uniref:Uncharacterized protein n=1 Tax=Acidobacterium capsulatum (strain ATCC 51196 / DSM 11244 / BCRC 80197 / JCM 7670 / NBRC 15755 / NCIMB 13165 / 161) TaxID=240015 RepID=C1F3X1_ACIC5|nr:hypothetical protein ACP_2911 [Acidobacterium capsulatum ATCC 51196]
MRGIFPAIWLECGPFEPTIGKRRGLRSGGRLEDILRRGQGYRGRGGKGFSAPHPRWQRLFCGGCRGGLRGWRCGRGRSGGGCRGRRRRRLEHGFEQCVGDGRGQDDTVFLLPHTGAVDDLFDVGVHVAAGGHAFEHMRRAQDGLEAIGGGLCLTHALGDLLDAQAQRAGPAERGHEGGVRRDGQGHAKQLDWLLPVAAEGQANLADAPGEREQGYVLVVRGQQRGAGEGHGGGAIAVHDGVNLLGGGGIADGDHVIAEQRHTIGAALVGDVVDGVAGVVLLSGRDAGQIFRELAAVEVTFKDLGVGDRPIGSVGRGHALEGEGHLIEIALEDDAGGLDEFLVLRAGRDRIAVKVRGGAQGREVDVDDAVGFRQQPRDLWRGFGSKVNRSGEQEQNGGHNGNGDPGAPSSHGNHHLIQSGPRERQKHGRRASQQVRREGRVACCDSRACVCTAGGPTTVGVKESAA